MKTDNNNDFENENNDLKKDKKDLSLICRFL